MGKATFRIDAPKPAVMASVSRALDEIGSITTQRPGYDAFANFRGGQWLRDELTVTSETTIHPASGDTYALLYHPTPNAVKLVVLALTDRRTRLDCDWSDRFGAEVGQLLELLAQDFPEMQDQLPAFQPGKPVAEAVRPGHPGRKAHKRARERLRAGEDEQTVRIDWRREYEDETGEAPDETTSGEKELWRNVKRGNK